MLTVYEPTAVVTTATWLVNGVPTDPTTVTLKFRTGKDNPTTVWVFGGAGSIVHVGPGVFSATIPTTPGDGTHEWIGTGAAAAADVGPPFKVSSLPL